MVLMTKTDKDKDKSKFSKMLHDDVEALIANIEAAVKLLEGMMGKANKDRDAKKLAGHLKHLDHALEEIMQHAKNFGYEMGGSKSKRRKKHLNSVRATRVDVLANVRVDVGANA